MSRLFILDPVCAQLLGHNLTSLVKFRSYFSSFSYYDSIIPVASRLLPEAFAQENEVEQAFHFYYHNRMKVSDAQGRAIVDATAVLPDYEERMLELATTDAREFFERFSIGAADSLFFPSVDFFSCLAIFEMLRTLPPERAPRLYLRFIGVMEYSCRLYPDPKRELLRQVKDIISRGYPVFLSAEASVYADHLAELLDAPVAATPVPPFHDILPMDDGEEFVVVSPGSGRIDKGFNLLPSIISDFRRSYPRLKVRFLIQNLPPWDLEHNMKSASQIYAAPGVELLPSSISFEEMTAMFRRAHLVLMPYAADIYELRSSAILTESVGHGRQIITSRGTGFEKEVSYFNLGLVCADVGGYVAALAQFSQMSRRQLTNRANQARHRYTTYCLSQYKEWLK
ncbi:hypothetical protein FBZ87_11360 [Nitrospirillum amazonense]|uniref:Glycosyltransferase involved in cell wall biosynthesis n=1 Tax=Nitrospirillum amazonense TaxID=28077 RepID=A0A560J9Y4_9PROT|nr:glycosyltransferase [Nitrospirillum amazonense]TWB67817.1 hypothetical protein FBZ87_11360 [Nitrospirillum amazonense]